VTRPRLKIVCADHDEVIAKVVDTDEGPAYGNPQPLSKNFEDLGGHLDLDLFRVARREFRTVYMPLDPSEVPIEDPQPYQLAARGPVPAYCRRCRRTRAELEVRDLIAKRGTWRI
jgi:hypothetical protein